MARTDTLGNFLTDVAEAIRTKEGTTETITASEFDTRISNLSGGEDLTEELTAQDDKLTTQETTIASIVQALQGKGAGTPSDSGGSAQPYIIGGRMGSCTRLNEGNGTLMVQVRPSSYSDGTLLPSKILLYGFARSDYTLTQNGSTDGITILAEKICPEIDGITQRLFVAYYDYPGTQSGNFTDFYLNQTDSTVRGALGSLVLVNSGIPIVINDVEGTGNEIADINITTDDKLNIYLFSQVYSATHYGVNFSEMNIGERVGSFISNFASDDKQLKNVYSQNSYNTIIHIQCPFERVTNNE